MSRKMQAVDTGERDKIAKLKNEIKSDSNTKVEWIYSGDKIDRDAYLLGKPIDKMLMEKESEKPKEEIMVSTVDLANKIRDDPLFEIKKREIEAKKRLLENPLRLKQLQQMLSANSRPSGGGDEESSSSSSSDSEDERRKKKHKKKHKKEHKKKKTSREESRDRSKRHRSKSRSRSRSRSPQRQRKDDAYGLKKASSSAKDETSHRKDDGKRSDKAREIDEYKEKIKKLKEMQKSSGSSSSSSSSVAQPSKKLSDEEKRRRLEEMQANAKWRDQVRSSNVSKMEQDEKREKRLEEASKSSRLQTEASNMFNNIMKDAYKSTEDRIRSNIYNIQRNKSSYDSNFARK